MRSKFLTTSSESTENEPVSPKFTKSHYNPTAFTEKRTINVNEVKQMTNKSKKYRKIHFAVMVLEATAKKQNVKGNVMYQRLKAQDLIRQRLLQHYEALHTQSLDWVVEDTIETLNNWEQEQKEYAR